MRRQRLIRRYTDIIISIVIIVVVVIIIITNIFPMKLPFNMPPFSLHSRSSSSLNRSTHSTSVSSLLLSGTIFVIRIERQPAFC